jgi:hypothetical protein
MSRFHLKTEKESSLGKVVQNCDSYTFLSASLMLALLFQCCALEGKIILLHVVMYAPAKLVLFRGDDE